MGNLSKNDAQGVIVIGDVAADTLSSNKGARGVGIENAGHHFTSDNVEGALTEAVSMAESAIAATNAVLEDFDKLRFEQLRWAEPGLPNSDTTIDVTVNSEFRIRGINPYRQTADRNIMLSTTGATNKAMIRIVKAYDQHTATVINGGVGGGTLFVLPASKDIMAEFLFDGTNWALNRWAYVLGE